MEKECKRFQTLSLISLISVHRKEQLNVNRRNIIILVLSICRWQLALSIWKNVYSSLLKYRGVHFVNLGVTNIHRWLESLYLSKCMRPKPIFSTNRDNFPSLLLEEGVIFLNKLPGHLTGTKRCYSILRIFDLKLKILFLHSIGWLQSWKK